jgi:hypothetical protein
MIITPYATTCDNMTCTTINAVTNCICNDHYSLSTKIVLGIILVILAIILIYCIYAFFKIIMED